MLTLRLISFNLRQRLKRFKYILKRTTGELRRAVWCLQEAKGLKGLAAMGYAVVKPEVESDLLLAVPKHLQPQVGHSVLSHRRWMACQLGRQNGKNWTNSLRFAICGALFSRLTMLGR